MKPQGEGTVDPRVIRELWEIICERAAHPDEGSYTGCCGTRKGSTRS